MAQASQASSALPSIPHYVNVFNKTTKVHSKLTPQVHPLLASLQAQFDIASAMHDAMLIRIAKRAALGISVVFH